MAVHQRLAATLENRIVSVTAESGLASFGIAESGLASFGIAAQGRTVASVGAQAAALEGAVRAIAAEVSLGPVGAAHADCPALAGGHQALDHDLSVSAPGRDAPLAQELRNVELVVDLRTARSPIVCWVCREDVGDLKFVFGAGV